MDTSKDKNEFNNEKEFDKNNITDSLNSILEFLEEEKKSFEEKPAEKTVENFEELLDSIEESLEDIMLLMEEEGENIDKYDDDIGESSVNIPLNGSPSYPRIYTGDSARPLMGQYPESEYKDDNNIHQTWLGLMSYYG